MTRTTPSNKPMRIVHWYQNFLGGGGVANAALGLANSQSQLGHEVLISAMKTEGPALYEPLAKLAQCEILTWQPRISRINCNGLDLTIPDGNVLKQLKKWQPDIVHIHGEYLPSNIWVGRAANCPVVLTPHGVFHPRRFDSVSGLRRLRQNLYVGFARALFYSRLDGMHALSPIEEHQIRKMMPEVNVYSIPQGPSVQMGPLLTGSRREAVADARPTRLLFVGRLDVRTKGLDILLPAFEQALRKLPSDGISLKLVGPDWKGGLSVLQEIAAQLGITGKVEFTGAKDSPSVAKLLCEADIFVLLSRNEGFPLSLTEALIAGKPSIVSTEVGSLSYQEVASLRYIYPVRPDVEQAAEAIAFCIRNIGALRNSAADFTPQAKEFFDWARIARLHIERYRELQERNWARKPGRPVLAGCESR